MLENADYPAMTYLDNQRIRLRYRTQILWRCFPSSNLLLGCQNSLPNLVNVGTGCSSSTLSCRRFFHQRVWNEENEFQSVLNIPKSPVPPYLGADNSVGESSGLISPSELMAVFIIGISDCFLIDGGLWGSSFFSMLPSVAARVFATSLSCGVVTVFVDPIWSSSVSSSADSPGPMVLWSASWVCLSISLMSAIVKPCHSSCQAQAWRCALTIVFRSAWSCMNFSSFVCIPQ